MKKIKLSYDALIALLQGKNVHFVGLDGEIEIISPLDGVYLTHEEIARMRYDTEMNVLSVVNSLQENQGK